MAPPRITVGLPFLNAGPTLADAVRSVFAQTLTDWRLLLLDDGSTDASLAIARSIRDPRVTVVSDGAHRGLPARLNELAALADTPFLARMDADDLMHPERLARQVAFLEAHPEVDAVGAGIWCLDADGAPHGKRCSDPLPATVPELFRRELFAHPTVTYRTAFARVHPYDGRYPRAEDLALWCAIRPTARLAVLSEPLLLYREPLRPDLRAYAATAASRRKLLRDLGGAVPAGARLALTLRSHATVLAYRAAAWLGQEGLLVQRRNEPLGEEEAARVRATRAAILACEVPGLEVERQAVGPKGAPATARR